MEWVHNEGIPVHSGASQVAQWERICLPTQETQETWVPSLSQEDPLEEEMATHSSILAGEFHGLYSPWGCKESDMTEQLTHISPAEGANKFLHFHFYQIELL